MHTLLVTLFLPFDPLTQIRHLPLAHSLRRGRLIVVHAVARGTVVPRQRKRKGIIGVAVVAVPLALR